MDHILSNNNYKIILPREEYPCDQIVCYMNIGL